MRCVPAMLKTISFALTAFVLANSVWAQAAPRFSEPAFVMWLAIDETRRAEFAAFETFLAEEDVAGIVPAYQLWRTSSSSGACEREAFQAPERAYLRNIVRTLEFIRDHVEPAIGDVEALSGYRDDALNACSGGRPGSAHRRYFALDLMPADRGVTREDMVSIICTVHARHGARYEIGLGFYNGRRFHLDSMRFRRWGPDTTAATSLCLAPR